MWSQMVFFFLVGITITRWARSLVVAWTATVAHQSVVVEFSSLSLFLIRYLFWRGQCRLLCESIFRLSKMIESRRSHLNILLDNTSLFHGHRRWWHSKLSLAVRHERRKLGCLFSFHREWSSLNLHHSIDKLTSTARREGRKKRSTSKDIEWRCSLITVHFSKWTQAYSRTVRTSIVTSSSSDSLWPLVMLRWSIDVNRSFSHFFSLGHW